MTRSAQRNQTANRGKSGTRSKQAARGARPVARARSPYITYAVIAAAVLLLLAGGIYLAGQSAARPMPGEAVPIQSREHIAVGQSHPAYNSDPPTGGWHYENELPAGFYDQPAPDERVVHSLEHGYVVMSYDCSRLASCDQVKTQLRAIVQRYNGWKVIALPRQNKDTALALTAWGRIEKLNGYDEGKITGFIDAWRDQGPEKTAD